MQTLVDRNTWLAARKQLLLKEKELSRKQAELAQQRRQLPMVKIDKSYIFQTDAGPKSLLELFGSAHQLIIYHFMFGPEWQQGCPSCSFWADSFSGLAPHLSARDTTFISCSNAPLEKLNAYKKRLGWSFEWVSTESSSFSADFAVSFYQGDQSDNQQGYNYSGSFGSEELPGISIFRRLDNGDIGHSYSCYARGIEAINPVYQLLDLSPIGRNEDALNYPMAWVKRNDEY